MRREMRDEKRNGWRASPEAKDPPEQNPLADLLAAGGDTTGGE